jgi:hypothetical protein
LQDDGDNGRSELHLEDSVFFDPRVDPFITERVDWPESSLNDKNDKIEQISTGKTIEPQRTRQSGAKEQPDNSGLGQNSTSLKPGRYL